MHIILWSCHRHIIRHAVKYSATKNSFAHHAHFAHFKYFISAFWFCSIDCRRRCRRMKLTKLSISQRRWRPLSASEIKLQPNNYFALTALSVSSSRFDHRFIFHGALAWYLTSISHALNASGQAYATLMMGDYDGKAFNAAVLSDNIIISLSPAFLERMIS